MALGSTATLAESLPTRIDTKVVEQETGFLVAAKRLPLRRDHHSEGKHRQYCEERNDASRFPRALGPRARLIKGCTLVRHRLRAEFGVNAFSR